MQDTQVYQPPEKSIFLDLLNSEEFLDRYEHSLKGEVLITKREKDEKGRDIVKSEWLPRYPPKMNDLGIISTMSFLRTICDKSMSLTDLSTTQIDTLVKQNADAWLDFLCVNSMNFELNSPSQIREVYYPARNLIVAKFRSAVDGMMTNAISKTTHVSEVRNLAPEQAQGDSQKPGFLQKLGIKV
jgi:hypothetical protein